MKTTAIRMFRRGFAYTIDCVFVFVFIRPELFVVIFAPARSRLVDATVDFLAMLLTAAYVVGSHWRWGRTLGKRALGLRVATLGGLSPPPFRPALLRCVPILVIGLMLYVVDWFILPYWSIGMLTLGHEVVSVWRIAPIVWLLADTVAAIRTEGYRSIHDALGGTVVTDEAAKRKEAEPDGTANAGSRPFSGDSSPSETPSSLGPRR